jgi:UDP-N-acetylmuramoylalanine--D-glutamate ligase
MPALARHWAERGVPVVVEREVAFQSSYCLHAVVAGACGRSTTAALVAHMLRAAGRRVEVADSGNCPASGWAEGSRDLDFLVHTVEEWEMGWWRFFRPVVAVVLNLSDDGMGEGGAGGWSGLFRNQQPFDWAIVQSEALARLQSLGVRLPGKHLTFSAASRQADLGVDRGLLVSRLAGWTGPLWDTTGSRMRGPHFAEDALAALAVGRVLRLPLDEMRPALDTFVPGPGRFEDLGVVDGVRYVHDGCSRHGAALAQALLALAPTPPEQPGIWLIAGGTETGGAYYDLGPVLSPRVKQALLFGEVAGSMRAAWSLFTPCHWVASLSEALGQVLDRAVPGDVVLFSPGCGGWRVLDGATDEDDTFRRRVAGMRAAGPAATRAGTAGEAALPAEERSRMGCRQGMGMATWGHTGSRARSRFSLRSTTMTPTFRSL